MYCALCTLQFYCFDSAHLCTQFILCIFMCSFYLLHYVLHCIVYYLGCDHRFMVHLMKLDQDNIYLDIIKLSFSFFVYWLHQHHKWRASTTYCSLDFVITCSPLYVSDLFFYIYLCLLFLSANFDGHILSTNNDTSPVFYK